MKVQTPRLRTARLDLAPLRQADANDMVSVLADPALHAFTGGDPADLETLLERFERLVVGQSGDGAQVWHNWIVRVAADGTAVGTVQATLSQGETTAEIAWVIGVPWHGIGYASEAAQALVAWLEGVGVTTITANVHPEHHASSAVATRAGLMPTDEIEDGERVWRRTAGPAYDRRMATPRFTMVVLLIEDLPRSLAFYRRLGVQFPADADTRTDVQVPIGDDHQLVLTTTFVRNDPDRQPPTGGSRIVLEFFVDDNAAVDALFTELTDAGYHGRREPFLTSFNAYMGMVDDPDGNTVLITAG